MEDYISVIQTEKSAYSGFKMMLNLRENNKRCLLCNNSMVIHDHSLMGCDGTIETTDLKCLDDILIECFASNGADEKHTFLFCKNCSVFYVECPDCKQYCNVISHSGAFDDNTCHFSNYLKSMTMTMVSVDELITKKHLTNNIHYFFKYNGDYSEVIRASKNECHSDLHNFTYNNNVTGDCNEEEVSYYYVGDRSDKFINYKIWCPTGHDQGLDHVWQCKRCENDLVSFSDK